MNPRKKLTKDILEYLISPETLQLHSGLNLEERAVMLHRRFPETKISPSLISRIYKKFRIKKKIVQIKKYSNAKNHKKIAE